MDSHYEFVIKIKNSVVKDGVSSQQYFQNCKIRYNEVTQILKNMPVEGTYFYTNYITDIWFHQQNY